jgi:tRNA pseudouridine55 synthase
MSWILTIAAIHKPPSITSFDVIRTLQPLFNSSPLFAPLLARERSKNLLEQRSKARARRDKRPLNVKIGHGGTLDPLATGVLIIGVGRGTKTLQRFLECTKTYECTVLFGAATDSYDILGKIIERAPYEHVTKEKVDTALEIFRGKIMQRPPIFSALRVNGKRMYEYAREGGEIPEIQERPVEVKDLVLTEWLEGGSHMYKLPKEDAPIEKKQTAERLLDLGNKGALKRMREDEQDEQVPAAKIARSASERTTIEPASEDAETAAVERPDEVTPSAIRSSETTPDPELPAARLRMTVTSGFYVRSLCHDVGTAVQSLGLMSSLVRTRQGEFELGKNVLEYEDFKQPEDIWGPKVRQMLEEWMEREGWGTAEESDVESDAHRKSERMERTERTEKRNKMNSRGKEKAWNHARRRNSSSVER